MALRNSPIIGSSDEMPQETSEGQKGKYKNLTDYFCNPKLNSKEPFPSYLELLKVTEPSLLLPKLHCVPTHCYYS